MVAKFGAILDTKNPKKAKTEPAITTFLQPYKLIRAAAKGAVEKMDEVMINLKFNQLII